MEPLMEAVVDFVKVRQLNFAVAGVLTLVYLVYQYWGALFRKIPEKNDPCELSTLRMPRTRSRSRSRLRAGAHYDYKQEKPGRARRYGRCPDCSKCNDDGGN